MKPEDQAAFEDAFKEFLKNYRMGGNPLKDCAEGLFKAALAHRDAQPAVACSFPERDVTKPAEEQGLFRKFDVRRVDGSDAPGGKHHGCEYFVLDLNHDTHAPAALRAYAQACNKTHPQLSAELLGRFGPQPAVAVNEQLQREAARYRWLRDNSVPPHNFYLSVPVEFDGVKYMPKEVDSYIDTAIRAAEAERNKEGV